MAAGRNQPVPDIADSRIDAWHNAISGSIHMAFDLGLGSNSFLHAKESKNVRVISCNLRVFGLRLLSFGVLYLSVDEFLPYHSEAIQADWSEPDLNYKGLLFGLLKSVAG